jgi:hypothetical protein
MRIVLASVVCASAALLSTGCVVTTRPIVVETRRPVVEVDARAEVAVEPEAPVIVDAAPTEVLRIDVEPAPVERVYVYEPGFPPGTYLFGGFYYYGGYRYNHDVFVHRYVEVNVRERRFINITENRRIGHTIEERHRTEFVKYGPKHESHPSVQRAIHETKTVHENKTVHTEHADPKTVHTETKTVHTDPKATHVTETKTVHTTETKTVKKDPHEEEHR